MAGTACAQTWRRESRCIWGAAEKADWEGEKQKARTRKSDSPKTGLEDELGAREEQEGRGEARTARRGLEAGPGLGPSGEA